jgi:hypothetical protein
VADPARTVAPFAAQRGQVGRRRGSRVTAARQSRAQNRPTARPPYSLRPNLRCSCPRSSRLVIEPTSMRPRNAFAANNVFDPSACGANSAPPNTPVSRSRRGHGRPRGPAIGLHPRVAPPVRAHLSTEIASAELPIAPRIGRDLARTEARSQERSRTAIAAVAATGHPGAANRCTKRISLRRRTDHRPQRRSAAPRGRAGRPPDGRVGRASHAIPAPHVPEMNQPSERSG